MCGLVPNSLYIYVNIYIYLFIYLSSTLLGWYVCCYNHYNSRGATVNDIFYCRQTATLFPKGLSLLGEVSQADGETATIPGQVPEPRRKKKTESRKESRKTARTRPRQTQQTIRSQKAGKVNHDLDKKPRPSQEPYKKGRRSQ